LENKLDPRVDSDLDGRNALGTTGAGYGANAGTGLGSGTTGVSERTGTNDYDNTTTGKQSTADKLLSKIGMK